MFTIGNHTKTEFKKGHPQFNIGKTHFKKGHKVNLGRYPSEKTKKKIGEANKGRKHPDRKSSPHYTEEHKRKISEANKGEKGNNWKGGLTAVQKLEKIAGRKKPKQCEICGAMGKICFDHDHKTGEFRGWICGRCNFALGLVKDNIETLMAMIEYLKNFK